MSDSGLKDGSCWSDPKVAQEHAENMAEELDAFVRSRAIWNAILVMRHVEKLRRFPHTPKFLDVGCGAGVYARPLLAYFDISYHGRDPSEAMIHAAKVAHGNLDFRVADTSRAQIEEYDIVFAAQSLEYAADPVGALKYAVLESMQPGAVFILQKARLSGRDQGKWITERTYAGHSEEIYLWGKDELISALNVYLRRVHRMDWPFDKNTATFYGVMK